MDASVKERGRKTKYRMGHLKNKYFSHPAPTLLIHRSPDTPHTSHTTHTHNMDIEDSNIISSEEVAMASEEKMEHEDEVPQYDEIDAQDMMGMSFFS